MRMRRLDRAPVALSDNKIDTVMSLLGAMS